MEADSTGTGDRIVIIVSLNRALNNLNHACYKDAYTEALCISYLVELSIKLGTLKASFSLRGSVVTE